MSKYKLQCGDLRYEVEKDSDEFKAIRGAMFWSHCLEVDKAELHYAENEINVSEEEINELRCIVEEDEKLVSDFMSEMEKLNVPYWVGNGAMFYSRNIDLAVNDLDDFFRFSAYAVQELEEAEIEL